MPTLKYQGFFSKNTPSGFVTSPNALQQDGSNFLGLIIDWDGPSEDLNLTYKVGFRSNTFLNGLLNPNTLIMSGGDDFITTVQVNVKHTGWLSFLSSPALTVTVQDANGNTLTAKNGTVIQADSGIVSFSIAFN